MSTGTLVHSNQPTATAGGANTPQQQTRQSRQTFISPATAFKPRTGADIIRELEENRAREAAAVAAVTKTAETAAEHDARVENVYALFDADARLMLKINDLNKQQKRHTKGSAAEQIRQDELDATTADLNTIRAEQETLKAKYPLAHEEGLQRYNRRIEANEMASANRALSATVTNIRSRIEAGIGSGFVVSTNQDDYEFVVTEAKKVNISVPAFSFDRQYFTAVKPWDPEAVIAVSISEMIADLQADNDKEDEKIMAEVRRGDYFLSTRRDPDGKGGNLPSGLDLFRKEAGSAIVRRASMFLAGKGQFYVTRVGKEFVVAENRNETLLAIKVSGPRTGRVLCTVPDTKSGNGVRVARPSPANIVTDGHTVSATDVSGIWWDKLRQAFEQDLQSESESLTFNELRANEKGTCAVSVYWKTGDVKDPKSPEVPLRFKLVGSGNGTFQATNVNPGILTQVDPKGNWLVKAVQTPQPLETLDSGRWPAIAGLNKTHERDWRLDNLAEEHDANRVSTDNVDGLTGVENGKDGIYAVRAIIKKPIGVVDGKMTFRKNAVGYIVARSDSATENPMVEIVDAVPGTSVNFANKLRGKHEIASLPWRLKVILGSCDYGIHHGNPPTPAHLVLTSKQQQEQEVEAVEASEAETKE